MCYSEAMPEYLGDCSCNSNFYKNVCTWKNVPAQFILFFLKVYYTSENISVIYFRELQLLLTHPACQKCSTLYVKMYHYQSIHYYSNYLLQYVVYLKLYSSLILFFFPSGKVWGKRKKKWKGNSVCPSVLQNKSFHVRTDSE